MKQQVSHIGIRYNQKKLQLTKLRPKSRNRSISFLELRYYRCSVAFFKEKSRCFSLPFLSKSSVAYCQSHCEKRNPTRSQHILRLAKRINNEAGLIKIQICCWNLDDRVCKLIQHGNERYRWCDSYIHVLFAIEVARYVPIVLLSQMTPFCCSQSQCIVRTAWSKCSDY